MRRFPGIESVGLSEAPSRLRVAIVTEEIIGPVRNGGIASTYYHLAKGLAAQGHEVHVLFLKGPVVQDETPEFWVERYAEFGVTLHYLDVSESPLWCASPNWQRRYASAYEWLRDQEPFDVVHTSEWRGGLVYALMAKRLGLAFRDTLFLVKTSSPHIWNRHYQMLPITDTNLVAAAYAEQKCVELADMVIGGSAHLLSFMERIGYRLPPTNVFVQPNIVDFSNVPVVDRRPGPPRQHGDVVKSRDLVFFGRLEARKGIEIFCNAIDLLHERGEIPDSVTFLGKWGGKLQAQGGMSPEMYLVDKAESWECPVVTVTDKNQPEALAFLTSRDLIAVMPSLIENSTMAVYETLEQRVPFIATSVGGTPELVAERDHAACLVEPTAQDLADRLAIALREGQMIAHPQFSNDDNLDVWYGFHAYLGEQIEEHGSTKAIARLIEGVDKPADPVGSVSYVALVRRSDALEELVKACHAEPPDELVLGYTDVGVRTAIEKVRGLIEEGCPNLAVVNCLGQTSGTALNTLAAAQSSDAMLVADGLSTLPQFGFFAAARLALSHRPSTLFTTFFATDDTKVGMPLGGDVASQILTSRAYGPEVIALRKEMFDVIGGFEPYDARHGIVHEYVTRAAEDGHDLLVLPEQLLSWSAADETAGELTSDQMYAYLKAKPLIDASPLSQRKVLLAALSSTPDRQPAPVGAVSEWLLRTDTVDRDSTQWLTPATWDPESIQLAKHRRVIIGLHTTLGELWFYARGPGERRLLVRDEEVPTELVATRGVEGTDSYASISVLRLPDTWSPATSYPLIWGLYDGEEKLRNVFLRVNKIGPRTFAVSGRTPALSARIIAELMERPPGAPKGERAEWTIENVPTDSSVVVERSRALLQAAPAAAATDPRSGLRPSSRPAGGWAEGDWLSGWAWDREEPDRILHVAVMRGNEPLLVVPADVLDRSLEDVPGRGAHGFRIPVLPDFLAADELHLNIWEGAAPVHRGGFFVDRKGAPLLRRIPERVAQPVSTRPSAWRRAVSRAAGKG
ncbi:glycosyltransferase family 4 protein [Nocardioides bizhenqiangii]|uniref:Glycosyltransferase family 4 protein n=1 Tax=Nocardioides bizhenqiangii TaxID=3095076 RepID=A0ABZ0ZQ05_9ACTN|nr:glycosyltransferase family 4 protein [Nocardioides sp. HM61]WQQ25924.1 glycosyltransferase family 4 protein [Nocardioides sp. HM61]